MTKIYLILLLNNALILFYFKKFSNLINIYDKPDKKLKVHKFNVPLIGGTIIFINYILLFIFELIFKNQIFFIDLNLISSSEIFSLSFFIASFYLLGLYDDKFNISPNIRLIISIILTIIILNLNKELIINDLNFSFKTNQYFLNNYSFLFTIFCIIILKNSLNFYDGINCQSGIFFIYVFFFLLVKSGYNQFYLINLIIISIVLFLNSREKLFFGDSGIYLMSALISICLIYEYNINNNIIFVDEIFLLLILPGLDLVRLTISRILSGKNAFYGDRNHLHHLLIRKYNLLKTNILLALMGIFPIILFSIFKLNFFIVILMFTLIYFYLILKLSINDT